MPEREPDCALVLAQVEDSVRAMRRHITNFQRQLLLLSIGKKVEITCSQGVAGKGRANGASMPNDLVEDCERFRAQ
jgi:hypothetical protein